MATQYEVEHGIKSSTPRCGRRRQIDMSSFTSHFRQIFPDTNVAGGASEHHNPYAVPNAADMAGLYRLLQDQMGTLALTAPSEENRAFLRELVESLEVDVSHPLRDHPGVPPQYLDSLDRVPHKKLESDETCPICAEKFLDDQYCLVVELPCHHSHRFDLECVGPWLLSKGTCPICRKDLNKKKDIVVVPDDDEDKEDSDGLYA